MLFSFLLVVIVCVGFFFFFFFQAEDGIRDRDVTGVQTCALPILGESEKHIAGAFAEAKARKPAILFFDEIEALAARRRGGDHDHTSSMVSTFLSEFDGLAASHETLLVVAATNVPWMIDTAFRRPGRF